jgi:molybdopterin converting factor small subunit
VFAEKMGRERVYELNDDATIEDLVEIISKELEEIKSKGVVYVNYRFPKERQILNDGDEILIMPLFAGG